MAVSAELVGGDSTKSEGEPSREAVRRALAPYQPVVARLGLEHFFLDYAVYGVAIFGVLFFDALWLKILFSVVAGIKISNLGTLGHDAAHGNLTESARANKLLAILCFLPGLNNYRLWVFDHHHLHHPSTNGGHPDAWTPFSKEEYDALPRFRRLRERFYRSSWGLGMAPYYIIERWWKVKVFPRSFLPQRYHASAWRHFALVLSYVLLFGGALATAPLYSNTGSVTAVLLGLVVPFYVWKVFFSFTSYVQHTHARIPWFREMVDHKAMPPERVSLHLEFPGWLESLSHNVYNHPVHHVNMRIPFHQLAKAQRTLNEMVGASAVVQPFSFGWLGETLRNCRLYDYEGNRWLDFDGRPTTARAISSEGRAAARKGARDAVLARQG